MFLFHRASEISLLYVVFCMVDSASMESDAGPILGRHLQYIGQYPGTDIKVTKFLRARSKTFFKQSFTSFEINSIDLNAFMVV